MTDIFTPLTVDEERAQDRGHVAGGGAAATRSIAVSITNGDGRPALEWAREYGSFGGAERHEARTVGGYDAARTAVNGKVVLYVVSAGQRVFILASRPEDPLPDGLLDAIASSFSVSATVPLPTPVPPPASVPQGARDAAERLATALERADLVALAMVATPRCWIETWSTASGPIGRAVQPLIADLRMRLQAGLRVTVNPTVQVAPRAGPSGLRLFVSSDWTEAGRTTRANLYLREVNSQWFWGGIEAVAP
ncbi:MAG: hypothetical protein ACRDG6_04260 [Candidatus Limnocylindria bacterium]